MHRVLVMETGVQSPSVLSLDTLAALRYKRKALTVNQPMVQ
jgi:hypothetical protein